MRETESSVETWSFQCQNCRTIWQDTYEARHHADFGSEFIIWRYRGVISMPPWLHAGCSTCPGASVRVIPLGGNVPCQGRAGM
ncbi:hypothetical protein E1267_28285 [Nonomuraea longispora]|uniref:Uncharacterized protein n=1 Tax=Nonomuraea longispora TaxID=1848320 RepID=A0A4R4N2H1_9ACTN|nr:hypothetical protein [Nonomuraea longispora]TDC02878.1 hypothetical protein E1267_28285 [Nonomuraea longispora]